MTYHKAALTTLGLMCIISSNSALAEQSPVGGQVCLHISSYYSDISADSNERQRSLWHSLERPKDACEQLKLGLLLSHPAVSFQSDAGALDALTQALMQLPDEAVHKPTLGMLIDHINERQQLRNMLGGARRQLNTRDRQLTLRQRHINTLRGQIDQLKNLEVQLEDKARAVIEPDVDSESANSVITVPVLAPPSE